MTAVDIRAGASVQSYWDCFAEIYPAAGSPLIPSHEDLRFMEAAVGDWAGSHPGKKLQALLLGVTPTIAGMRWPEGSLLTALDRSAEMAKRIWPGNIASRRWVVRGDWLNLPLGPASCDVVIGDIAMNCLGYPDGFRQLAASVRRGLSEEGIFVLRCFVQTGSQEDPDAVFADRFQCANFHHLKFRLLMAMQRGVEQGSATNDVYRFWTKQHVDYGELSLRTGWDRREIETIELHKGPNAVYTFPTLPQLRSVLAEFFGEMHMSVPSYPCGDRCPTLVLRP